jgi:hypothetical protein
VASEPKRSRIHELTACSAAGLNVSWIRSYSAGEPLAALSSSVH